MSTCDHAKSEIKSRWWQLFIDGASRHNPGQAGVGIFLANDEQSVYKQGFFVGIKTNNQAEYIALLIGSLVVKNYIKNDDLVQIYSDSELLVKQMRGEYRVKDAELQKLQQVARLFLSSVRYDIGHVLREKNKVADALANAGIDNKIRVPETFLAKLNEHAISL